MSDEQKFNISETFEKIFKRLDNLEEKINHVSSFDIENLDPDKRSWYYDGDGTKRKKSE